MAASMHFLDAVTVAVCDTSKIHPYASRHAWPWPRHAQSDWVILSGFHWRWGSPSKHLNLPLNIDHRSCPIANKNCVLLCRSIVCVITNQGSSNPNCLNFLKDAYKVYQDVPPTYWVRMLKNRNWKWNSYADRGRNLKLCPSAWLFASTWYARVVCSWELLCGELSRGYTGAAALAARERRNKVCFLKFWALPWCSSRIVFHRS